MEKQMRALSPAAFAELIDLPATLTSLLPVLTGTAFSLYRFGRLRPLLLLIFLLACWTYNCFTNIWNEYQDYQNARDTSHYKAKTNSIGRNQLSVGLVRRIIAGYFALTVLLGLSVVYFTGWQVLVAGVFCYSIGIFYSWGPKPLSALPVGEVVSGLVMGGFIFLIALTVNAGAAFPWTIQNLLIALLIAFPNVLLIKNVMLANNICDEDEDLANGRETIVAYIGRKNALRWWGASIVFLYVCLILSVVLRLTHPILLLSLLIIPLVWRLARPFLQEQNKKTTFLNSIALLFLLSITQSALMAVSVVFK